MAVQQEVAEFLDEFGKRFVDEWLSSFTERRRQLEEAWPVVDEYLDTGIAPDNSASGVMGKLSVPPQSSNLEKITQILAYSAGSAARVRVGTRNWIIPSNTLQSIPCSYIIASYDERSITPVTLTAGAPTATGAANYLMLQLMGKEVPIGALQY